MSCPDADTWASYLRGSVDGDRATELREHLDTCETCRAVVAKASVDEAPASSPLHKLMAAGAPIISFKESAPTDVAVTVRPSGDDAPSPAVTMVPSGEDE